MNEFSESGDRPLLSTLQLGMEWFSERPGGLDRVYYELYRHLPNVGVEFRGLVAGTDRVAEESDGKVQGFAPASAPVWQRWWKVRRAFGTCVTERRPDLVVSHFALYTFPVLDRLGDLPLAVHFQGPWAAESSVEDGGLISGRVKAAIEGPVYRRAQRLICLSQAFFDILVELYRVDPGRVSIVPGGVDAGRFASVPSRAEARARLGWPTDRPVVLAVRRLVRRMGLEDLITAMIEIRRRVPDALLLVAGRGPLMETFRRQIEATGLSDHVRLLGFVADEDLPLAYRAADLTVVPTVALEGFGLIAAESLAAGTPSLVTPVGGLPEVVSGLSQNLVLPGTGSVAIAEGVIAALGGGLSLPAGEDCARFAAAHYNWPVIARRLRNVYSSCVAGRYVA